ncbi:methyltransferase domain-containing protein [Sphingomonas naphthae]|uniref:Methyltransferase domain-containing protein n=1 Tax=Sphingomonas naphthae TaxID=1813468 RepID=A0ABY7TGM2_9SPHN|nr:methyltransferase domain-containing protein [Sphingomonas naphthae]WCT72126.1 methyltransferase domain-containing protein [Sphingomonas naphthae]
MDNPQIFDPALRRLRRDRAAPGFDDHAFLIDRIIEGLLDRLDMVTRPFRNVLEIGGWDGRLTRQLQARGLGVTPLEAGPRFAAATGALLGEEDRPAVAERSVDLVISAGVLDQVSDLPGALALARRALRPDGLFLAAFAGAGSLPQLRRALMVADIAAGQGVAARLHPQIDVRSAGDLLVRAGFALPVADSEPIDVGYADPLKLMRDLRGMAWTSMLAAPHPPPLTRGRLAALIESFSEGADADGRVRERFEIVYLTGWAPSADQPKPARRGSATASLAAALKPRD